MSNLKADSRRFLVQTIRDNEIWAHLLTGDELFQYIKIAPMMEEKYTVFDVCAEPGMTKQILVRKNAVTGDTELIDGCKVIARKTEE